MKTQVNIEAFAHTDVRGKVNYHLKIEKDGKEMWMDVGLKTYTTVTEMTKEGGDQLEQLKMELEGEKEEEVPHETKLGPITEKMQVEKIIDDISHSINEKNKKIK